MNHGDPYMMSLYLYIARTHAHAEITHFPVRCTIRAWETRGCRQSAFQALTVHRVGKCAISTWAWVLAFIPSPTRNIKAAMQKSRISAHPFSAWIVTWSWDKSENETHCLSSQLPYEWYSRWWTQDNSQVTETGLISQRPRSTMVTIDTCLIKYVSMVTEHPKVSRKHRLIVSLETRVWGFLSS